jgi:hypothetical protein
MRAGIVPRMQQMMTMLLACASPAAGQPDGLKSSARESPNPYLFVVGVPRSGTTLLQRMLDAHPQLSVVNEAYWLGRDFRWPRARFVHIIRDPRDVCLSMLDWDRGERNAGRHGTWGMDPIVSSALFWRLGVSLGREAGGALGPDLYRELRYEDLIAAPADQLRKICAFLDLPYAAGMLNYHHGKTGKPWRSSKAQWLPPTPGLREWDSQMARPDAERVEAAAGDLLGDLGYASRVERCSAQALERVAAVCERFTAQLRASGEEVPKDWPC